MILRSISALNTSNMADYSAKATNSARTLAIAHVIVGFLLVIFGRGDYVAETWTGVIGMGIWTGVWVSRISNLSNTDFVIYFRTRKCIDVA